MGKIGSVFTVTHTLPLPPPNKAGLLVMGLKLSQMTIKQQKGLAVLAKT